MELAIQQAQATLEERQTAHSGIVDELALLGPNTDVAATHQWLDVQDLEEKQCESAIQVFRAEEELIKRKAQLTNLVLKAEGAMRNGHWDGRCLTGRKEDVTGTLMHRQVDRAEIHAQGKCVMDGRDILRQLVKSKAANQLACHFRIINSYKQVHSIRSCHMWACTEQGEKEGYHVFEIAAREIEELQRKGLLLKNVAMRAPDGEVVLVRELKVNLTIVIVPDGANMFKLCEGTSGGSSHFKCPICDTCNNFNADTEGDLCENISYACKLCLVNDGDETWKSLAMRHNISVAQLYNLNTKGANKSREEGGCMDLTIAHDGATEPSRELSHVIDQSLIVSEDEKIRGSSALKHNANNRRVVGTPRLRVRIGAFEEREMIPQLADHGMSWKQICLCARHGDMRSVEWLHYLLVKHIDLQKRPLIEVNKWLDDHDCKIQFKMEKGKVQKPSFNGGFQADLWFKVEKGSTNPHWHRWMDYVDFMETDPKERAKTREGWDSYATLRAIMNKQLPTKAEREFIGPATFQHFLKYRMKYAGRYVHLYSHLYFHHATSMMQEFGSIGLYRNEAEECCN